MRQVKITETKPLTLIDLKSFDEKMPSLFKGFGYYKGKDMDCLATAWWEEKTDAKVVDLFGSFDYSGKLSEAKEAIDKETTLRITSTCKRVIQLFTTIQFYRNDHFSNAENKYKEIISRYHNVKKVNFFSCTCRPEIQKELVRLFEEKGLEVKLEKHSCQGKSRVSFLKERFIENFLPSLQNFYPF